MGEVAERARVNLEYFNLDQVAEAATKPLIFGAVRGALIAHAERRTQVPEPMHLTFPDADGDCHVKAGYCLDSPHFAVKIATGFYANSRLGLETNDGLMLLMSATTGSPLAVLADNGWLTAWRTAAAGALITDVLTSPQISEVGVLGAGLQAQLQVEWLHELRPLARVMVWGRHEDAAARLVSRFRRNGLNAVATGISEAAGAECVITATAAHTPLIHCGAFTAANHVTAIGADMPGKSELPPELFARAATIATDDHSQCLKHGDFGNAVRAGWVRETADTPIGTLLRDEATDRRGFSIADLTGVGALDAQVASAVFAALAADLDAPPTTR
jgi:ornithine cyclodeaminase/alanine dehydrogenase-like protein (mu-crystallin family)